MPVIIFTDMMKKLRETKGGATLLVVILTVAIFVMLGIYFLLGGNWMLVRMEHGNDGLMANTADSIARVNSNNGMNCVVDGCGSTGYCPHYSTIGYIGYFDNIGNIIVGEKPKGYNEYNKMEIGKNTYYGDPGTMVLKVVAREGEVTVSWEKGKE